MREKNKKIKHTRKALSAKADKQYPFLLKAAPLS